MMQVVREETKMVLAQLRRNISSASSARGNSIAGTVLKMGSEQTQVASALSSVQQQRHLQHITTGSANAPGINPTMLREMMREGPRPERVGAIGTPIDSSVPVELELVEAKLQAQVLVEKHTACLSASKVIESGKKVEVEFKSAGKYVFHTSWLKDSASDNFGSSFNRNCPHDFGRARSGIAKCVDVKDEGSKLRIEFDVDGSAYAHEYDTRWLQAFAPYVAQSSVGGTKRIQDHGPLLSNLTCAAHKSPSARWGCEKKVAEFTYREVADDIDEQIRFLEVMAIDGAAVVYDLPPPSDLSSDCIGIGLEHFVNKIVGAMYQPPRRKTNYGVMRKNMAALNIGNEAALADYNFENPLSMHTDHAIYEGTPGYLQFNWQAQGSVSTKVCNGISVAEHIRATNPSAFKLLSTIHVTHAVRTNHYTFDGEYANSPGRYHEGTFEQAHTHPIIQLDQDNNVVQVIHNELKRGVSAIPFDVYDEFIEAYSLWKDLCEDPRFTCEVEWPEHSCVVLNNHFVLHGRATPMPGTEIERIMSWGYTRKDITENRYRLLQQRKLELMDGIHDDYTRNVPNQVLTVMFAE